MSSYLYPVYDICFYLNLFQMPPKRKNRLKVATSGRVEIVEVVEIPEETAEVPPKVVAEKKKKKTTKSKAKKGEVVEDIEENVDDEIDIADCESKDS